MNILNPSLVLVSILAGSTAFAQQGHPIPASTTSTPPVTPSSTQPVPPPVPVRPLLQRFAHQEALHRYGEGALGLAGSGVLIGAGFAPGPDDRAWSYALWISGGAVALGSIGNLLVPSKLEELARDSSELSDEELRMRWRELATARRLERRAGAVVGGLLGATSIVLGGLVLERELGDLDDHPRRMVGWGLVASGALGIVENGVQWFVPSPLEMGAELATSRPALDFALAPTRSGFTVAVAGEF